MMMTMTMTMMMTMVMMMILPAMAFRQQRGASAKILWWSPRPADDGNDDYDDSDDDADIDDDSVGDGDGVSDKPYDQCAVPPTASATALAFQ